MLMGLICIITIILLIFILYRYKIERAYDHIPGPRKLFFFGSMFDFIGDAEYLWEKLIKIRKMYGPTYRTITPGFIVVNIMDPSDIEIVFNNTNSQTKSSSYGLLQEWLGTGLLTNSGEKWKTRRKVLTPGFHFNILNKYLQTFLYETQHMIKIIKKTKRDLIINTEQWASDHTLRIICETAMGCSSDIFDQKEGTDYKHAVHYVGQTIPYRLQRPWYLIKPLYNITQNGRTYNESLQILHNFSWKIINERLKETSSMSEFNNLSKDDNKTKKVQSMLDILIDAYKRGEIDKNGIREEVDTFVFEGHDTTALALSYSLLCLAEYEDVQSRAREEVDKVWKECGGNISIAEIQKFAYLERAIKEVLRLFPSVPSVGRKTTNDLQINNYIIPKGTDVHILIYEVHRNPKFWANPLKYDVDRFLPENSKKRHAYSYIPFSGGPRNCIGQKFAMLELKTILGYVLHNFYLKAISTTKDIKPFVDLVLRSKQPLYIKFIPIDT